MSDSDWQISVDTGGTFTDCFGIPPGGGIENARLVKVLSSGRLRVAIAGQLNTRRLRLELPESWNAPDECFTGFVITSELFKATATTWDSATRLLTVDREVPPNLSSIDLSTGEEAPVIGARLLTGTGLNAAFPPIDFRLGTTRGTNALLERKGAPVAFFVTRGFGDLLMIRDQRRPDLFALNHQRPTPLYESGVEIEERISADGSILTPLDSTFESEARAAVESGIRVAAVALLHSYANPAHERLLRTRLLDLGFEHVSLSSELAPLIKILPRAETAVVDAYLTPVMQSFVDHISEKLASSSFLAMTSAGGLEPAASFRPKDSLLSGPAGGVVGAATSARVLGFEKIITFDMGGTSTDVARFDGDFLYRFEQKVGDATLLSPALKIETVAAGGGSICRWSEAGLRVGPESAGADPGPACYGRGGPLTITDINLLLGRIDPDNFGIPIGEENVLAAREALVGLGKGVRRGERGERISESVSVLHNPFSLPSPLFSLLLGLAAIATEQMADAIRTISIRDGAAPSDYALLAFGGAGPLHACDIAERLGMTRIIVPKEAGLLSAYGIHHAAVERFAERQILKPLGVVGPDLSRLLAELNAKAIKELTKDLGNGSQPVEIRRQLAELRLAGQDSTLTLEISEPEKIADDFRRQYESTFGYDPPAEREIELVSLRVIASTSARASDRSNPVDSPTQPFSVNSNGFIDRGKLQPGTTVSGPAVIQDPFSTLWLKDGWTATVAENLSLVLTARSATADRPSSLSDRDSPITRELFRHRFENLVGEMGAMLQRSAISTNVKERADFSCALLDANGDLVVNAPHIPVHLGALGLCVRTVAKTLPIHPGDVIITNHPGFGGSHLPDVTLITPIFSSPPDKPIGYVANRAHHAEIGGISPGSMPADARNLAEEGVVIVPDYLFRAGESRIEIIADHLTHSPFPTRNLADNLADLHAQTAANHRGAEILAQLIESHGEEIIRHQLETLATQSQSALQKQLQDSGFTGGEAVEKLDDGAEIRCRISIYEPVGGLTIDFTGTAESHPGNLNATPAIVRSAVLYVLRLWTQSDLPLNEGLLRDVEIILPRCFLNPEFPENATECPAVVGGNVETSQRIVDTLIRILGIQAGSQGTMNNFIFGDDSFGYYETIGGGAGAGSDYDGASGLHSHMTNTAITDPEILEYRYPIRLRQFSIRPNSGGDGEHRGGDGLIREVEFLKPLRVSLLTQHRIEKPCGLAGGEPGKPGHQTLRQETSETELPGVVSIDVNPGDVLRIETPGGGGFGPVQ